MEMGWPGWWLRFVGLHSSDTTNSKYSTIDAPVLAPREPHHHIFVPMALEDRQRLPRDDGARELVSHRQPRAIAKLIASMQREVIAKNSERRDEG